MQQLLSLRKHFVGKASNKIPLVLILLLAISIPMPIRINAVLTVVTFIYFILIALVDKDMPKNRIGSPLSILIVLSFFISTIGLIYTSDLMQGWLDLERSAFLIALLFIIYKLKRLDISVFKLIVAFTIGTFVASIYGLVYALTTLKHDQQKQVFELGHSYFADIILVHPTYLSVYFIFIFFFLAETLRTKWNILSNTLKISGGSSLLLIIAILFFLRSQMSLIIFVMLLVMYTIIVLKKRAWLVTFVLFTVTLLVFLLDSNRVTTFFDTYGKNVSSALDQRFSVWRGTIAGIRTAPFFGAGTGGEQKLINQGYAQTGYQEGIDNSFNAHNQYLQFLARNGVLELVVFLALLIYSFRQSLKMPNYTFLMFNMAVTLIMFTESFLDVQRGIVFFFFFLCAFIYLPYEPVSQPAKSV